MVTEVMAPENRNDPLTTKTIMNGMYAKMITDQRELGHININDETVPISGGTTGNTLAIPNVVGKFLKRPSSKAADSVIGAGTKSRDSSRSASRER